MLDPIAQFCLQHDLPPLTALVMNKEKAKPGAGFPSYDKQVHRLVEVFEHDWYSMVPPSAADLDQAAKDAK